MSLKQIFTNIKSNISENKLLYVSFLCFGLFIGSLLVDFSGLGKGNVSIGYLESSAGKIFQAGEKTWVAYNDPIVEMTVLNDLKAGYCDASKEIEMLKQNISQTITAKELDISSAGGKNLISLFGIKTIPAFVFSKNLEDLSKFQGIEKLFKQAGAYFLLDSAKVSLESCKILDFPKFTGAKVDIVEVSDYQCPYCKRAAESLKKVLAEYEEKEVQITHRHLPLDMHGFAEDAAIAAECARKQGKFSQMNSGLFESQFNSEEEIFEIAKEIRGMDFQKFKECYDYGLTQNIIDIDKRWADELGISGTPAFIINGRFIGGALDEEGFKKIIEEELSKF